MEEGKTRFPELPELRLKNRLGKGGFGSVFRAWNKKTQTHVAVKISKSQRDTALKKEASILKILKDSSRSKNSGQKRSKHSGFPTFHRFKKTQHGSILVMELLGESLNSLLSQQTKFKLPTVVDIGRQVLGRLKSLHSKGFVHRDVKPPNLLLSRRTGSKKVYLIDFGLSDRYILTRQQTHIPQTRVTQFQGTTKYASYNMHLLWTASRRDDLESWLYCLLELATGGLPWEVACKMERREDAAVSMSVIRSMKADCQIPIYFPNLPLEFQQILGYIRALTFDQDPDYKFLLTKLVGIGAVEEMPSRTFDLGKRQKRKAQKVQGRSGTQTDLLRPKKTRATTPSSIGGNELSVSSVGSSIGSSNCSMHPLQAVDLDGSDASRLLNTSQSQSSCPDETSIGHEIPLYDRPKQLPAIHDLSIYLDIPLESRIIANRRLHPFEARLHINM